ncbi:MAG: hypothetical protein JWM03_804 [Rhodocyclales bacterium]|nr:hypothetical protein [Rhodocyclales bacterium]MDB5887932.1 hypothetical protein [Rhodocyclales bacterium]
MKRALIIVSIVIGILAVLVFVGHYFALRALKSHVESALGPNGSVTSLQLTLTAVEIDGLRVRAAHDNGKSAAWPVEDEIRAEHVRVEPDLRSLFTNTVVVRRIVITRPYLPMLRTSKGLKILPSLFKRSEQEAEKKSEDKQSNGVVRVSEIELIDGSIDFFDATLGGKLHRIQLGEIRGQLDNLKLPGVDEEESIRLQGTVPSSQGTGSFTLNGDVTPSNLDSALKLKLHDVPLITLEPYFIKAAAARVKHGTLQLDLDSTVKKRQLHAPGKMVLSGLELDGDGFAGLSRQAGLLLLKDQRDRIDLDFSLDGNLDDPKFSLNEQFYVRVGSALANVLGLSVEGLGKGVGGVVEGVGGALKKLFGD